MFCRSLTCTTLVPDGQFYCRPCGGLDRARAEGLLDPKPPPAEKKVAFSRDSRGVVPVGQGLGRFSRSKKETPAERATREADRAKLRAKRLAAQPPRGKGGKSNNEGTGTSKKSRHQQKKNRKRGAAGGHFK